MRGECLDPLSLPVHYRFLIMQNIEAADKRLFALAIDGLLTLGVMIFLIGGLFLREITRLKFGVLELEKVSVEQLAVSTSPSISRQVGNTSYDFVKSIPFQVLADTLPWAYALYWQGVCHCKPTIMTISPLHTVSVRLVAKRGEQS